MPRKRSFVYSEHARRVHLNKQTQMLAQGWAQAALVACRCRDAAPPVPCGSRAVRGRRAGGRGGRERPARGSSQAAEEGKRGTRPAPPAALRLAPAARPPSIGRVRRPGALPLASAVLDTKFKVFKKRPARAGRIHCPRRRWRGSAGERGAGSELRREPLRGSTAGASLSGRLGGSGAPRSSLRG